MTKIKIFQGKNINKIIFEISWNLVIILILYLKQKISLKMIKIQQQI